MGCVVKSVASGLTLFAFCAGAAVAWGEARDVATPAELVAALGDTSVDVINLTAASYDLSSVNMDFGTTPCHLRAKSGVKVYGRSNDPRATVLFGNRSRRIIYSDNSKFYNVTISNGYANAAYAGGVYAASSGSILSNCVVTCNLGEKADCGGVAWATCYDCEICYNSSKHGGGASHNTMYGGSLHHNEATNSGGGGLHVTAKGVRIYGNKANQGAGLSSNTSVTISDCEIFDNVALNEGGGGCCITPSAEGVCIFTNCVFYGNQATSSGGGAAKCHLIDCIVSNNTAVIGGGISAVVAEITLIADNKATSTTTGGGGAYGGTLTDCVVSNNTASAYGGGCYGGEAIGTHFVGNTAVTAGGGLSTCTSVSDCVIVGNRAQAGGGSHNSKVYSSLLAENVALETDKAKNGGGGSYADREMDGCVVSNNVAYVRGGGVDASTVKNSRVVMNRATSDAESLMGGGAYGGTLTKCVIAGNACVRTDSGTAGTMGGGVYDATLTECAVYDNYAKVGSAMHSGTATGCVFSNNVSSAGTYTIRCSRKLVNCFLDVQQLEAPGMMLNCTVTGGGKSLVLPEGRNVAASGTFDNATGTLIVNTQSPRIAATNCLFYGNRNDILVNGPYNAKDMTLHLSNCTFVSNRCDAMVGTVPGTAGNNGSMIIENCIFSGNYTKNGTTSQDFKPYSGEKDNQIYMSNCLITQPPAEDWTAVAARYSNIQTNSPRFVAKGEHPYQLRSNSPARNCGLVYDWMQTGTDIRGAGYPRLSASGNVDLGCYQYWMTPAGFILMVQ